MNYSEKLKDPRWQKRRLEILNRDNFTCQWCGDDKSILHIHHFCYPKSKNPWDSEDDEMITLCEKCHEFNHLKGIHPVIENTYCLLIISPKLYGEAFKILRHYTIEFYKKGK